MSANTEQYKYVFELIGSQLIFVTDRVSHYFGNKVLAYLLIGGLTLPLTCLFFWSQYILLPRFILWWYEESITQKAVDWWRKHSLNFLGFKQSTAVISVLVGFLFYVWVRAIAAFPAYLLYTVPSTAVLFMLVAVLGYFVSGNVPGTAEARRKYCKRFQSPTVTGLGLALVSLMIDFMIGAAAFIVDTIRG
jgi:hypothetical protein